VALDGTVLSTTQGHDRPLNESVRLRWRDQEGERPLCRHDTVRELEGKLDAPRKTMSSDQPSRLCESRAYGSD
jgi:hypothetical protein